MIKTTSEIEIHVADGRDTPMLNKPSSRSEACARSHLVELAVGDSRWQVTRADLQAALAATDHQGSR